MQVLVRDNNVDQALKALKKKMQREGIFREMKLRGHYEKPSEKKAREKAEAIRRARKLARKKMQREGLLPMKPRVVPGAGGPGGPGGPGGGRGRGRPRWRRRSALLVTDTTRLKSSAGLTGPRFAFQLDRSDPHDGPWNFSAAFIAAASRRRHPPPFSIAPPRFSSKRATAPEFRSPTPRPARPISCGQRANPRCARSRR